MIEGDFVIRKGVYEECLELFPRAEYDKFVVKMFENLKVSYKDFDRFQRMFNSGTLPIKIEENGRLQIPKNLKVFAGIEKDVVLSSAFDKIEIWDRDRYDKFIEENQSNYDELAEKIFARHE